MIRFPAIRLLLALAASLALIAPLPASATSYSGVYVFGDSLSDSGNLYAATGGLIPSAPYFGGRFTNGPNYADYLAALYGHSATAALFGGTNYAFGGATAGGTGTAIPSLGDQVSLYRGLPGGADASALYVVWAGGNDLRNDPSATGISSALSGVANAVLDLYSEGARNFLVMNMPNLGLTPEAITNGTSFQATLGSAVYNAYFGGIMGTLQGALTGSNIRTLDTFGLLSGIVANPGAFGFTNVTDPCLGASVCANPDSYLFWDSIHPTAAAHRLIALAAYNVLAVPEPETWALLLTGLVLVATRGRRKA